MSKKNPSVLWSVEQVLETNEKAQARANIGVDAAISGAIDALDAEEVSTDGTNVQFQVTETDGKITGVSVTTDNTVNATDVSNAITTAINGLDSNATSNDGTNVQVKVTETDGKISAVNITSDNTVNSTDVSNAITTAINGLDVSAITGSASKTITSISETDGKISATYSNISITKSQVSDFAHTHSEYKTVQTAVPSPDTDGTARAFIDTISQNTNGVISVTKKSLPQSLLLGYKRSQTPEEAFNSMKLITFHAPEFNYLLSGETNLSTVDIGHYIPLIQSEDNGCVLKAVGGAPKWSPSGKALVYIEIPDTEVYDGYTVSSGIYNEIKSVLDSDREPVLYRSSSSSGVVQYDYYRLDYVYTGQTSKYYEFYKRTFINGSHQTTIIKKWITQDDYVYTYKTALQNRLTAGEGIAIDTSTNTISWVGTGQAVTSVHQVYEQGNVISHLDLDINREGEPHLNLTSNVNGKFSATYLSSLNVQSTEFKIASPNSSYYTKFNTSSYDLSTNWGSLGPSATRMVGNMPTSVHSIYPTTPTDRVAIFGNNNASEQINKLGNLTVGTIAIRLIDASSTSENTPMLASCVPGELSLITSKNSPLYAKHQDCDTSAYVSYGDNDGWLAVTTKAREIDDAAARAASLSSAQLGRLTFFPSKNYVDSVISNVRNSLRLKINRSPFRDTNKMFYSHEMTLTSDTSRMYEDLSLVADIETALDLSTGSLSSRVAYGLIFLTVRSIRNNGNSFICNMDVCSGSQANPTILASYEQIVATNFTCVLPVLSQVSNYFIRLKKLSSAPGVGCSFMIDYTILNGNILYAPTN